MTISPTYKPHALSLIDIQHIIRPYAQFLAAVIDTAPVYEMTPADITRESAKATEFVCQNTDIVAACVASGTGMSARAVKEMFPLNRALLLADVARLTQEALGFSAIRDAVMAEIAPLSELYVGTRH